MHLTHSQPVSDSHASQDSLSVDSLSLRFRPRCICSNNVKSASSLQRLRWRSGKSVGTSSLANHLRMQEVLPLMRPTLWSSSGTTQTFAIKPRPTQDPNVVFEASNYSSKTLRSVHKPNLIQLSCLHPPLSQPDDLRIHHIAMLTYVGPVISFILLICSRIVYCATWLHKAAFRRGEQTVREDLQAAPHRHTCRYCRQICVPISCEFPSGIGLLIQLSLTFEQVREFEARACPLLERAHNASTAAISERIRCHLQTFFDVFSASSNLHALTGCSTFVARARYFARGLSTRPYHLHIARLSDESDNVLRARVLYTSWRLFEFNVSADECKGGFPIA